MSEDAKLRSLFDPPHACPDCGAIDWSSYEDSGHDVVLCCNKCGSRFGVQLPPISLIDRIR